MSKNINIWKRWEWGLLFLFLLSRTWILIDRFGEEWGFDTGAHLNMISLLSWRTPTIGVRDTFYSYHPPLGFLLPHTLTVLGFTSMQSIQLTSLAASLIAFFCIRALLKFLNLLYHPVSLAFLYLTASIPLQVYLSSSINLDVLIFAAATIVLYCSVRLWWSFDYAQDDTLQKLVLWLSLITTLLFAMLTKFNGILLLALPILVAVFKPQQKETKETDPSTVLRTGESKETKEIRHWNPWFPWHPWFPRFPSIQHKLQPIAVATSSSLLALTLIFPYYFTRYYLPEGTFFPSNTDGWMDDYRAERDKDRWTFLKNMFLAPTAHAKGTALEQYDFEGARLYDTWNGIWARSTWFRAQSETSVAISKFYMHIMPFLLILGGCALLLRMQRRCKVWSQLGWILLGFSIIELSASAWFIFENPYAGWSPSKVIYIAPIVFGIGYLLSHLLYVPQRVPMVLRTRWSLVQKGILGLIALFMVVNHVVPVY